MDWLTVGLLVYGLGFAGTLVFNMCILAVVTNHGAVLRNALLWPLFLPLLLIDWLESK